MDRLIPLTQGAHALVSADDYARLSGYRWHMVRASDQLAYAATTIGGRRAYMHRLILEAPGGMHVDHSNHNGLDNRRENLRLATPRDNHRNTRKRRGSTSRYKGVSFQAGARMWQAHIYPNGKSRYLGLFPDEESAARAYNSAAMAAYGSFASLNEVF